MPLGNTRFQVISRVKRNLPAEDVKEKAAVETEKKLTPAAKEAIRRAEVRKQLAEAEELLKNDRLLNDKLVSNENARLQSQFRDARGNARFGILTQAPRNTIKTDPNEDGTPKRRAVPIFSYIGKKRPAMQRSPFSRPGLMAEMKVGKNANGKQFGMTWRLK